MKQTTPSDIPAAFELLLEAIESEIGRVNEAGTSAFQKGLYEQVNASRQQGIKLTEYRDKIISLRKEWQPLSATFKAQATPDEVDDEDDETGAARRNLGRLQRGIRTPGEAYRIPKLHALTEMGGKGQIKNVLSRVEKQMQHILKEADYQRLPSNKSLRWYNSAQWERQGMIEEGLLEKNSPYGIWEITEAGRKYLAGHIS